MAADILERVLALPDLVVLIVDVADRDAYQFEPACRVRVFVQEVVVGDDHNRVQGKADITSIRQAGVFLGIVRKRSEGYLQPFHLVSGPQDLRDPKRGVGVVEHRFTRTLTGDHIGGHHHKLSLVVRHRIAKAIGI